MKKEEDNIEKSLRLIWHIGIKAIEKDKNIDGLLELPVKKITPKNSL